MGRVTPLITSIGDPILFLQDILGRRNEIVWSWPSFPAPWHLVYIAGYVVKGIWVGIRFAASPDDPRSNRGIPRDPHRAAAPSRETFALDRRLREKAPSGWPRSSPPLRPLG